MERIKESIENKEKEKDRATNWLIVGLGNPEPKYAKTKHNIGYMVLDKIANDARLKWKVKDNRKECYYKYYPALLIKPQTGMNESGEVFKYIEQEQYKIICIYDDIDLPIGQLRLRPGGSSGGHNGIKSIIKYIDKDFVRVRLGVGRPVKGSIIDYVLEDFTNKEQNVANEMINSAVEAVARITQDGIQSAMQFMNRRE